MAIEAVANIETQDPRASTQRTTIVVIAYLAMIAVGALLPIISPSPAAQPAPFVTPARQVALFVQNLIWLVPLLVAMERDPERAVLETHLRVRGPWRRCTPWHSPGSRCCGPSAAVFENVALGVLFHLLLAFPSGHLRDRFDRAVIGAILRTSSSSRCSR